MKNIIAYLQLCRAANVFTALADVFLGYLLTHADFQPTQTFGLLLASSAGLYMAGMVLNDLFDWKIDARERPERPIPSGRVSLRAASVLAGLLILGGCAAATLVGPRSTSVVSLLVGCILAYDGWLKRTPLGPVLMGGCRCLNVMLGASVPAIGGEGLPAGLPLPDAYILHVAGSLGVYIAGVTWFARQEAGRSVRWSLGLALVVINLGLALLLAFVLHWPPGAPRSLNVALIIGLIAATLNHRAGKALWHPGPAAVRQAITTMLLSIVMLDATVVMFVQPNPFYAVCVAGLLAPALILSRFLAMT